MKTATRHVASIGLRRGRRAGFTLVELMVVIGVIALLIAIVLPAVNNARIKAKAAASKATISVLESGTEQYRASDRLEGAYPPSAAVAAVSPHETGSALRAFYGANLIAWALVGADMLGTPGFRDVNNVTPGGRPGWADDTGINLEAVKSMSGLYALDGGKPVHQRQGPFVDVSKLVFPKRESNGTKFEIAASKTKLNSICFLDSFGQPILYYRAKSTGRWPVTNSAEVDGIYDQRDNSWFTGSPLSGSEFMNLGAGPHPMATLHGPNGQVSNQAIDSGGNSFVRTVWNPAAVGAVPRPHNADKFILISAGPDALYGTADDVANFNVNQ
ncbi:MAG: type II secretion system protein [Phycisphaerae bacterium]|nr:type II secretion system protein [Phycisphaerae bacterium]